jgi:hypothetical protein
MTLRGPRFSGDPVLEQCFAGLHRMEEREQGLAVKRVQAALIELGLSVGSAGADGDFGPATGDAVTAYKTSKDLVPNDPVVGAGTSKALDDDLFFDPPVLDPAFAEFSPAVVDHRVEPFVGLELAALISAPLDSWRHMLGRFALASLNSGDLLGIVAQSRVVKDLRDRFLAVADPDQPDGSSAENLFDDEIILGRALGRTVTFSADGELRAFIVIRDTVILGREVITRESDGTQAPVTLQGIVVHELTHARNLANDLDLSETDDTDTDVYADTALAQARSAVSGPTAGVLDVFISEMVARHVHWVVLKEFAGTPGNIAILGLPAEQLAAAVNFYFVEVPGLYDFNGYGAGINAQGDAVRFRQLELWLRLCADQLFSDDASQDAQATLVFQAAAQFCADQLTDPTLEFPQEDGLFPLPADFRPPDFL